MSPLAQPDRHNAPGSVEEFVPSVAAVIDDIVRGVENAIGKPDVVGELPDVLDRGQLRAFGRQRVEGNACRHYQPIGEMQSVFVDQQLRVRARRYAGGDVSQMQVYGGKGAHEVGVLAEAGAGRAEDAGRGGALVDTIWHITEAGEAGNGKLPRMNASNLLCRSSEVVIRLPSPALSIDEILSSPALLAHVVVDKYLDSPPFYPPIHQPSSAHWNFRRSSRSISKPRPDLPIELVLRRRCCANLTPRVWPQLDEPKRSPHCSLMKSLLTVR